MSDEAGNSLPSLQALMSLICDLQKTIALLTRKLEAYEERDRKEQILEGSDVQVNDSKNGGFQSLSKINSQTSQAGQAGQGSLKGNSQGGIPFSVNFASVVNSGRPVFAVDLNQGQTYKNVITAENLSQSMGSGILKKPYQLSIPQPGTGTGNRNLSGLVTGVGSVHDSASMSSKNGRSAGRYDPFKDRNNVAYHRSRQLTYSTSTDNSVIRMKETVNLNASDSRGSKRKLSPNEKEFENENDNDDSSGWAVATGSRSRRNQKGNQQGNQGSMVTPIVIRRRSCQDARPELNQVMLDSIEEQMEQDISESGLQEENDHLPTEVRHGLQNDSLSITVPSQLGDRSIFHTFRASGGMRDLLTVECQKINGEEFKGTITYTEAAVKIFQQELGLQADVLHSIKMSFNKFRTISFKLKKQIDIDELIEKENFEMKRSYMEGNQIKTDVISCKIVGIRKPRTTPDTPRPLYDGTEGDVQWVEISGCQYEITEGELLCWLNLYGEVLSKISEMKHPDSEVENPVGNGTYVVQMRLERPIPQFLPISGRKVRIYYPGIKRECTNCYGHHAKQNCRNPKVQWIEQVGSFMDKNPKISRLWYGKWWQIIKKLRAGNSNGQDRSRPRNKHHENDTWRIRSRSNQPAHSRTRSGNRDITQGYRNDRSSSRNKPRNSSNSRKEYYSRKSDIRDGNRKRENERLKSRSRSPHKSRSNSSRSRLNENHRRDVTEENITEMLHQIRGQGDSLPVEFRLETYTSQGMSKEDAATYIKCLRTQERLCHKLKPELNQINHEVSK